MVIGHVGALVLSIVARLRLCVRQRGWWRCIYFAFFGSSFFFALDISLLTVDIHLGCNSADKPKIGTGLLCRPRGYITSCNVVLKKN